MQVAPPPAPDDAEAVRECIRKLVGVIRQSSIGTSPIDEQYLEHIKKVIRVLSLSEEQVAGMGPAERAQVLNIRKNALSKMRLANTVRSSATPSDGSGPSAGSSPGLSPASPGGFSPYSSSLGSAACSPSSLPYSSAPSATHLQAQEQLCSGVQAAAISGGVSVAVPMPMHHVRAGGDSFRTSSVEPFRPAASPLRPSLSVDMPPPSFYVRKNSMGSM